MSAAVEDVRSKSWPFELRVDTPEKLAQLATRAKLSSSLTLQCLVTMAYDVVVLRRPIRNHAFGERLLELAAQKHAPAAETVKTSYAMTEQHVIAIRELRAGLQLSRQSLVVELVVQAALDTRPPDGGAGGGGPEDPLDRSRRLASRHNVERSTLAPATPTPLLGQRRLFSEEDDSEG